MACSGRMGCYRSWVDRSPTVRTNHQDRKMLSHGWEGIRLGALTTSFGQAYDQTVLNDSTFRDASYPCKHSSFPRGNKQEYLLPSTGERRGNPRDKIVRSVHNR